MPRAFPVLSVRTPTVGGMTVVQGTFDDLGTPLSSVTFVVVDLETTGGSPVECGITEIGAVKVRGGEVVGEFQTLVNPGAAIPAFISVLTGITDSMVAGAPRIEAALPAFLEFAAGSVLVAHNAGFDVSFLKAAARRTEHDWPGFPVLDTVHLARQLVHRDEVPNHRLASLARLFRATTTPDHRALHDARATVDVLHGLLERVGSLGVHSLEELLDYTARVTPARRRKRHLADDLPDLPGVYLFKDGQGRVLYVGTSVSIRTRVRSYFTASEHRRRMGEMVRIAESVSPIVCATTLEAEVRELRLIAEHKPRYNRRSRHPERALWVKLTVEPFPRLSIVRDVVDDGARYTGPFGSRSAAEAAVAAVHEVLPLRQCLERLSPRRPRSACALADMGRCGAPCTGAQSVESYAAVVDRAAGLLAGDTRDLLTALRGADGRARRAAALRGRPGGPRPARRPRAGHLALAAARPAGADPGARRGPAHAARGLGGRLRPARPPRGHHHLAPRGRPHALHRGAAGERRGGRGTPAPGHLRHAGGEREDPALARVPRGACRRGRRGVDLPRRRLGTRARRARAARDGPARGRGLRRRPLSAGQARRATPHPAGCSPYPSSDGARVDHQLPRRRCCDHDEYRAVGGVLNPRTRREVMHGGQ